MPCLSTHFSKQASWLCQASSDGLPPCAYQHRGQLRTVRLQVSLLPQEMLGKNANIGKRSKENPSYIHQGFENDRLLKASYRHTLLRLRHS